MDPLSTLSSHCDHGEVYLDAGELELDGSRSFHKDRFQFAGIDSFDNGSIVSGGSENVLESAGISKKPRRMTDFHAVPVLRRRGRLLLGRSDWTVSIVGPSCRVALTTC